MYKGLAIHGKLCNPCYCKLPLGKHAKLQGQCNWEYTQHITAKQFNQIIPDLMLNLFCRCMLLLHC